MRLYVFFLVTSLSFLILNHASAYLFNFYCYVIFSLPQSPPCFPHLSEHLFFLCTTFAAWTSCDQIGNDISEQTQASQYCEAQPVPSTEPNPTALCLKPKPLVWKRVGLFFFLSLVQITIGIREEKPTYLPQGPCLILYSLWIWVQGFFYYLPPCDSLGMAGRW